ncbi:MAG: hypothetical protein ACJ8C4_21640 [Gemmataceae bacterium]
MLLRLMLRILRIGVVAMIVVAVWVTWWLMAQRPLREMHVNFAPNTNIAWSNPTLNDERVMLIAYGMNAKGGGAGKGGMQAGFSPDFSPNGRLIIAFENPSTKYQGPWWQKQLQRHLPASWWPPEDQNLVLWNAQTGRLINRIPGRQWMAWTPDESGVWVDSNRSDDTAGEKVFELRSVVPPRAPWWLWAVTALGVVTSLWPARKRKYLLSPPS